MPRQGQFMVYSTGKPKEEIDIIQTEDYRVRVKKTWVAATGVWHIQFFTLSVLEHRFELFLSHEELKSLRDFL